MTTQFSFADYWHTLLKNMAEAAYRRGDLLEKRGQLISDWANFCLRIDSKFR